MGLDFSIQCEKDINLTDYSIPKVVLKQWEATHLRLETVISS